VAVFIVVRFGQEGRAVEAQWWLHVSRHLLSVEKFSRLSHSHVMFGGKGVMVLCCVSYRIVSYRTLSYRFKGIAVYVTLVLLDGIWVAA